MPFEDQAPLARQTVLIACSEMKAFSLMKGLESLGARVQVLRVIEIRELEDKIALDQALNKLAGYAWILFTSAYGVRFFLGRVQDLGIDKGLCNRARICAIGPSTGEALEHSGIHVSLIPKEFAAEGILAALAEFHGSLENLKGLRILLPRALEARDLIPRVLEAAGAHVDVVPCYENTIPYLAPEHVRSLLQNPPDWLVFTSSSAVNHFFTLLGNQDAPALIGRARVAVLGPITAGALASYGRQPDVIPEKNTIPALLSAMQRWTDGSELGS